MPLIREGTPHELLAAWKLRWVGEIVWDKQILGVGNFIRSRTEVLILAISRNGNVPLLSDSVDQVIASRRGAHSEKPEAAYELLEKVSPGPMIELFARRRRSGWDRWGLEA